MNRPARNDDKQPRQALRDAVLDGGVPVLLAAGAHVGGPRARTALARMAGRNQPRVNTLAMLDSVRPASSAHKDLQSYLAQHSVQLGVELGPGASAPALDVRSRRIHLPPETHANILLHELGHATGLGGKGLPLPVARALRMGAEYAPRAQLGAALGANLALAGARNADDVRKIIKFNRAAGIVSTLIGSGLAAEEVRAWVRAHKIGKDLNLPLDKRDAALRALGDVAVPLVRALPAVYTHVRARRKLKEMEDAERSVGR